MVLIAVGLALLVNQLASGISRYRSADWVVSWLSMFGRATRSWRILDGTAGLILMLFWPVVLVLGLQYLVLEYDLPIVGFAFACLVLIYCWGPDNLDEDVDQIIAAEDGDAARALAENMMRRELPLNEDAWTWQAARGVFRESVHRWFGVLLWFLVLGPAGALLFRLSHRAARCRDQLTDDQGRAARRLAAILDAPAALLTALGVAIVSDFDAIMTTLRRHFRRHDLAHALLGAGFVEEVGGAAVKCRLAGEDALESDVLGPRRRVALAMSMVWRTLVTWLAVLAAAVIAGWIA